MLRSRHGSFRGVEWLGQIPDDEVASRLRGAHVLCAPSLSGESFGMVLVEAMAARSAVVASDIPGYAYVVGAHGVLVPPKDPAALTGALQAALRDCEGRSGICSETALERSSSHVRQWSMEQVSSRYTSLYERLVS